MSEALRLRGPGAAGNSEETSVAGAPGHSQCAGLFLGLVTRWGPSFQASHPRTSISRGKNINTSGNIFLARRKLSSWPVGPSTAVKTGLPWLAATNQHLPLGWRWDHPLFHFLGVLSKEGDSCRIGTKLHPPPRAGVDAGRALGGCTGAGRGPDKGWWCLRRAVDPENWMNQMCIWEVGSIGVSYGLGSLVQEMNSLYGFSIIRCFS